MSENDVFFTGAASAAPSDGLRCRTVMDYELLKEFNLKGARPPFFRASRIVLRVIYAILFVLLIPVIVLSCKDPERFSNGRTSVYLFCLLLFVFLYDLLLEYVIIPRRLKKQLPADVRIDYVFGDEILQADSVTDGVESHETARYDKLVKVVETEHLILLFIRSNAAHLVDKRGFTQGSPDDLKRILTAIIPQDKLHFLK